MWRDNWHCPQRLFHIRFLAIDTFFDSTVFYSLKGEDTSFRIFLLVLLWYRVFFLIRPVNNEQVPSQLAGTCSFLSIFDMNSLIQLWSVQDKSRTNDSNRGVLLSRIKKDHYWHRNLQLYFVDPLGSMNSNHDSLGFLLFLSIPLHHWKSLWNVEHLVESKGRWCVTYVLTNLKMLLMISSKFVLCKDKTDSSRKAPVYLRITKNRKHAYW